MLGIRVSFKANALVLVLVSVLVLVLVAMAAYRCLGVGVMGEC